MNALFENIKQNTSSNNKEKETHLNSKDYYLYTKINNKQNLNEKFANYNYNLLLNNEKINNLIQTFQELNIQYLKERQNLILNDNKNIKNSKQSLNVNEIININGQNNKKKNNSDSFSEIKKFKTELCHSWELTGTCKYGLNVSFIIYNIYLIFNSVSLLMELMI